MKKFLCLLLTLSLLSGMFAMTSAAADNGISVTVANDLHYNLLRTSTAVTKRNNVNEDFAHVAPGDNMPDESLAIITSFLKSAGTNETDFVLLPGDLVDVGTVAEAIAFAEILRNFEKTYNKEVYVVPGNHDLFKTTVAEFEAIYAEFGYAEALENDPKSASYTVDLKNGYRLLAIDSCAPQLSPHGLNAERINWISEQCNKAKADGKKLIAIMHHNLLEHFILGKTIHPGAVIDEELGLADVLAKGGVKYIFTGHTHDSDIKAYTADDGSVIYDVVTVTLITNSCAYRVAKFDDKVKIETRNVTDVDTSLFPDGISENALKVAEENFTEYSRISTWTGLESLFRSYVSASGLKGLLKLEDEKMNAIIHKVGDKLAEVIVMPFEKEDETEEGKSIESIAEKYDTVIPDTDYENLVDLAITLYEAHNLGDENYPAYSDEVVLITKSVAVALGYALGDVSAEEYATVMSFLIGLADVNVPVDFLVYAGSGIKRMEGIEIYVTAVIVPLIREFTVDYAPGDNNVTLPGYGEVVEEVKEKSFWDKIAEFFNRIIEMLRAALRYLPF